MKVCFPIGIKKGPQSKVYNHFGSAPFFLIIDSETLDFEEIDNSNINHKHGQCNPVFALAGNKVDAVVVGGIGDGAKSKLAQTGATVYQAAKGSVQDNLDLLNSGKLGKMEDHHLCTDHGCGDHDHSHDHSGDNCDIKKIEKKPFSLKK